MKNQIRNIYRGHYRTYALIRPKQQQPQQRPSWHPAGGNNPRSSSSIAIQARRTYAGMIN
jgi:hypothetical protein